MEITNTNETTGTGPDTPVKPAKKQKPKTSKLKVLFAVIVVLIFIAGVLELLTPLLYKSISKKPFQKKELQQRLLHPAGAAGEVENPLADRLPDWVNNNDLHPYIGFTYRRSRENKYGFIGKNPLMKRAPGTINICIMGGSFAEGLFLDSVDVFKDYLKKSPYFAQKDINVTAIAMGGFKQPQQLFALTYFLFLGAEYDIVINLDGFNELALPYTENVPYKTVPYFPRTWFMFTTKRFDMQSTLQTAKIYKLRRKKESLRRFFTAFPLYHSKYLLFLWDILDKRYENSILLANHELAKLFGASAEPPAGDIRHYNDDETRLFKDLAFYWKSASLRLHQLSAPNGFVYFHFLQPNQYHPGSKAFSLEEKIHALTNEPYKYKDAVLAGYPLLIAEGENLKKENVRFFDLTMIFKNETRTLYVDKCCHLNKLGYDLTAQAMAKAVIEDFRKREHK